jgi:phage-related protein
LVVDLISSKWDKMRRVLLEGERPLIWAGSSFEEFKGLPEQVQDEFGYALGLAQLGGKHPRAKPWKGEGAGVLELVESSKGNAYRAVYTVRFKRAVYVLHAFQKKSSTGIKTARRDVELIHQRLKSAESDYKERYGEVD